MRFSAFQINFERYRTVEMKSGRRKVLAVLVTIILIASWAVSFFGVGDKVGNLGKELKYGLDINGGVYVLLEADTKETGTELTQIMNQTKSVLENRVNAMGISKLRFQSKETTESE